VILDMIVEFVPGQPPLVIRLVGIYIYYGTTSEEQREMGDLRGGDRASSYLGQFLHTPISPIS